MLISGKELCAIGSLLSGTPPLTIYQYLNSFLWCTFSSRIKNMMGGHLGDFWLWYTFLRLHFLWEPVLVSEHWSNVNSTLLIQYIVKNGIQQWKTITVMERSIQVQNWPLELFDGIMKFLHLNWYIAEWLVWVSLSIGFSNPVLLDCMPDIFIAGSCVNLWFLCQTLKNLNECKCSQTKWRVPKYNS